MDFLTTIYWENPVYMYLISLVVILLSIVVGAFIKRVVSVKFKAFADRTETKVDDVVAALLDAPLSIFFSILGIYAAIAILHIPKGIKMILQNLMLVIITMVVLMSISKVIDKVYEFFILPRISKTDSKIDDQVAHLIKKTLKAVLWSFGVLIIISNLGYDIVSLLTGLGLGGLAFAMAAKDTLSNIIGGVTIFLDRPFHIGDIINVKGFEGKVEDIGLRTTRIRAWTGHLVSVPNRLAADSAVENISARPDMRVRFTLGVKYGTDANQIEQADKLICEAIAAHEGVSTEKAPSVFFLTFGASSLDLQVTYYITDTGNAFPIRHSINKAILSTLEAHNIEIPFNTVTVMQENT